MLKVDEYVLMRMIDGDHRQWECVTHGYKNLEDAEHSMDNYYDKDAELRIVAFMG